MTQEIQASNCKHCISKPFFGAMLLSSCTEVSSDYESIWLLSNSIRKVFLRPNGFCDAHICL